jgi:hypothetical protein
MSMIIGVLKGLEPEAQSRVLDYVQRKLKLDPAPVAASAEPSHARRDDSLDSPNAKGEEEAENEDGINEVARKWMRRNSLTTHSLGALFSLGVEDIELVANKVPGKSKRERMHSVILLKGVASYLGSGVARFTHADLKETCLHYDAYDVANSTSYMKSFASEVSGSAKTGYTLSARGLASATDLVKALVRGEETRAASHDRK